MASTEFTALAARIDELIAQFVNFDIPSDRSPSQEELDKIASFKLLTHAEFEEFIEERAASTINRSIDDWETAAKANACLVNLVVRGLFDGGLQAPASLDRTAVTAVLKGMQSKAKREIDDNNGIKRDAFQRLAFNAGLFSDQLPSTLYIELDNYGKLRGELAHKGVRIQRVRNLGDARGEAVKAKQLLEFLEEFDRELGAVFSDS